MKHLLLGLVVILATACGSDEPEQPAEDSRSVSGAGLELTVPAAWDGRLYLADDGLSTLSVTEWRPGRCPSNWPGPWTSCPEAAWVRLVAGSAGYPITGETGSALVAEGRGHGFYIWATKTADERPAATTAEGWNRLGTVEGVEVFDDGVRRRWVAQGFVFWLEAGPSADSALPPLGEMQALVRWSLDLPPPD